MRLLFILAVLVCAFPSFAQEGDIPTEPEMESSVVVPPSRVEEAIEQYMARTGRFPETGYVHMVRPRICVFRDFPIPPATPHPHAGLVLRVLTGECLTDRNDVTHNFVHNGAMGRIRLVSEEETIRILELIEEPVHTSQSAP